MFSASLVLGLVLSTLYGALFHLWRNGGSQRLILYLALSWAGYLIGHFAGSILNINFDKIGESHIGLASLGSIIFLFGGYWLSLIETHHSSQK